MSTLDHFLQQFFYWVINTTIVCTVLVGLILLIKTIIHDKLSPRWHYILWLTLVFRLILPPIPEGLNKIHKFLPQIKHTSTIAMTFPSHQESTYVLNSVKSVFPEKNVSRQKTVLKTQAVSLVQISKYVWVIGIFFLGILTVVENVRVLLYVKRQPQIADPIVKQLFEHCQKRMSIKMRIPLVLSGKLTSPSVLGVIKPRILLSKMQLEKLKEDQLQFIFYHELAHIKRRDIIMNCLMNGLLILHWFNPIMWYAYWRMRQDQEIGCDALALSYVGINQKVEYGQTIIKILDEFSGYYELSSAANMAGGKQALKRRIHMIKQFKNKSYQWSVLGFTVVIVLSIFSLINTDVISHNGNDFTVEAATNGEQPNENQKTGISKNEPVNKTDKALIFKENSEVGKVNSAQETIKEGLHTIQQNAPFMILVPETNKLSLTFAFMNPVSENTKERNVDLLYNTSSGEVHIWESNLDVKTAEKNPLHAPGYNEKIIQIGTQDWNFTPHNDDKDLLIFTSIVNDVVVQVSGKIPYAELVEIISSLK